MLKIDINRFFKWTFFFTCILIFVSVGYLVTSANLEKNKLEILSDSLEHDIPPSSLPDGKSKIRNLESKLLELALNTFPSIKFRTYKDQKRILVTGGAGFVGSHLVDQLMLDGHEAGANILPTKKKDSRFNFNPIHPYLIKILGYYLLFTIY